MDDKWGAIVVIATLIFLAIMTLLPMYWYFTL